MLILRKVLVSFFSFLFILVGCQDNVSEDDVKETNDHTVDEHVLTDAMGNEVTIPANPDRVIASYLEDYLLALGITPVAQWAIHDGASIQDYLQEDLKDVPTIPYDLPFEVVTSFSPDLLIMSSADMVEGEKYEQYSKIAPTYVLDLENNSDWREKLLKIGEVFDKQDEAEKVLVTYDEKAKESKQLLKDSMGNQSVAAIWLVNNTFFIVSDKVSSGVVLYDDLGLEKPNVVEEISTTATDNWSEISLEKLAELDADHLFLVNSDKGNGAKMLEDPIWKDIPAVKKGQIYEYEADSAWLYSGPIANTQIIDDVMTSLIK
ncbi:iron-hydroxamate ABC transporter substrate-binding protein [Pseudogracilibacillus sp. ICA-222130]|uniref:iron-hydroxamate ABC transporter substrate-binding protein n=1 Tax=Pseudogracilibacillus sp. ICA-222130 TaxID=3134655 RepID=UPI0030C1424A